MCGILGIFGSPLPAAELRSKLIQCSQRLRHRGPDWSGYDIIEVAEKRRHGIGHERLAIIDPESGAQPLESPDGQVILSANGEIYNYAEVFKSGETDYKGKQQLHECCSYADHTPPHWPSLNCPLLRQSVSVHS